MEHRVENVGSLFEDSKKILIEVVKGTTDDMLGNISSAINNLKNTWKGKDAGVQIMNVITTYNILVKFRNDLSKIATNCMEIAAKYRNVHISNGVSAEHFSVSRIDDLPTLQEYFDNADTVNILPQADSSRASLEKAVVNMESLLTLIREYQGKIFNNWVSGGSTRENAYFVFENFIRTADRYSTSLSDTAKSIKTALTNYNF